MWNIEYTLVASIRLVSIIIWPHSFSHIILQKSGRVFLFGAKINQNYICLISDIVYYNGRASLADFCFILSGLSN